MRLRFLLSLSQDFDRNIIANFSQNEGVPTGYRNVLLIS
ncbi:hypothetical protein LEP1GSC137_4369, partial [Leptospira borgpetersenii str. Noumea 25]